MIARRYRSSRRAVFLAVALIGFFATCFSSTADFLTYSYSPRLARRLDTNAANDQVVFNHEPPAFQDCSYIRPAGSSPGNGTITYGFQAPEGQTIKNVIASQLGTLFNVGNMVGEYSTNNGASFVRFFQSDPFQEPSTTTNTRENLRLANSPTVLIRYTLTTTNGDNSQVQFCRDCNDAPFSLRFDFDSPVSFMELRRTIRFSASAGGTVEAKVPSGTNLPRYAQVKLTAKPQTNYAFAGWFGDVVSYENPLRLTLNDGKFVTAHFEATTNLFACNPPLTNLAHWWPGDGNGLDIIAEKAAVFSGNLSYRPGYVGLGFGFDGVVDFMVVTGPPLNWPWTVAAWVKREESLKAGAALMSSDNGAIKLEQGSGRKVGLTRYGIADWSFNFVLPTNIWTHLALVAVPGATRLYVDGHLEDILPNNIVLPLNRIGIGKDAGVDLFKGTLDELVVFPRALSTEEVGILYGTDKAGMCKPPRLLGANRENGAVALNVLGSIGQPLIFSRSFDLITWRPYSTNVNTSGYYSYLVPNTRDFSFFRVAGGD
jgi:hypothetical protein